MTVALTIQDSFNRVMVNGDFAAFIGELNLAAASGKQYVICTEINGNPVALDRHSIRAVRPATEEDENAYTSGN
jgi:hypothetical protein